MTDEFLTLTSAPWTTVLTFASGYAGYFIAHLGLRDHHQAMDQVFRVLLYGFWGLFAYVALRTYCGFDILSASAVGFAVSSALGGGWRMWGEKRFTKFLHDNNISHSDDLRSAWLAIPNVSRGLAMTEFGVVLTDGTSLLCNDLWRFRDQPNGPCVLGNNGDVLIYVTHIGRRNAAGNMDYSAKEDVMGTDGAKMTYIPRDQIARITMRRRPKD